MIERAHRIAYSSKDNLIDERNNKNANIFTRTTIEVNSILVKKAQDDSYVSVALACLFVYSVFAQ